MKHAAKINLGGLVIDVITIGDDVGKYPEFTSYLLTEDTTIEEGKMKPVEDEE